VQQGELLTWLGQAEEGVGWIHKAMRLNPYHPERYWSHLARAYFTLHRYVDAAAALKHTITPDANQLALLAACHAQLGERAISKALAHQTLAKAPDFTITNYLTGLHYEQGADREHHREALSNAGLPA
jgi:adenylate cyclase